MNKILTNTTLLIFLLIKSAYPQLPVVFNGTHINDVQTDETVRKYLSPVKVLWQTSQDKATIKNAEVLLKPGSGQADLSGKNLCVLQNSSNAKAGVLLDFGRELHGGLQLITEQSGGGKPVKVRIRFGESAS